MVPRDLGNERLAEVAGQLVDLASDKQSVKVLPSLIVLMRGTLGSVKRLDQNPAMERIDSDTKAPIEALLDS